MGNYRIRPTAWKSSFDISLKKLNLWVKAGTSAFYGKARKVIETLCKHCLSQRAKEQQEEIERLLLKGLGYQVGNL